MIFLITVIAIILIYLFLVFPRTSRKPDTKVLRGVHYAHRGLFDNRTSAPENSLKAFQNAADAEYGIEMDVQLSKDGIPVVFHDATLKRMCKREGNVWDYTLKELKELTLADSKEAIPTLEEALAVVNGKVPLIIEYKLDMPSTKVCKRGNEVLEKYQGVYCVESFHPYALMWYRKYRPDVIRGQLSKDFSKTKDHSSPVFGVVTHLLTNFLTRPDFIAYKHTDAHIFSRRLCRKLGALSVAYTIKSQEAYEKSKDEFELFIFDSFILR